MTVYGRLYDPIWDTALTAAVAEAIGDAVGGAATVLEVGAGTGLITQHLTATHDVVAIEPAPTMVRRLRRRCREVTVVEGTVDALPGLGAHDAVVACNVLHMTNDPEAARDQLIAAVADEGRVVIATPAEGVDMKRLDQAMAEAGVGRAKRLRFRLLHLALAPLTLALGASQVQRRVDVPPPGVEPDVDTTVHGVTRVIGWTPGA